MERLSIIQQLEKRTVKSFGHHPWQCKKRKKFWSSSSDPVYFNVDTSHEKLESMSESDAMNVSGLSQDLPHSDSPFYMEAGSITSDLPQNETKNVKRESEFTPTLLEDIHSTQDILLGDTHIGSYSQNVQIQPVNTSTSSWRQFEPICKFHQIEAFYDEVTFQNPTEGFCTEKPELQSHAYNYAKDTSIKQDSFTEENPMETTISTHADQLSHECVRQSPRSPSLIHYNGETLQFMEKSLAKSTAVESSLNPSQPQSFLYKESVPRNVENTFYNENSFDLLDLGVNYKTEETEVSSKEMQNSEELPEVSVSAQEEVTAEGVESLAIPSAWSPAGISPSGRASQEHCVPPGMEQGWASSPPSEEDMALSEALQKLRRANRKQQREIQDLQGRNLHLEKKVEELQMGNTKQQVFISIIKKLKEKVEELIEDKYSVILEKNDIDKKLQNLEETLANTQKCLQESKKEKETLQLEVKKVKVSYIRLQERYSTEMQQKNRYVNQCLDLDRTLSQKEEEIEGLQQLKGDLEKATASALDLLKREEEVREQEFMSFQEEFQKREKENLRERRKLKSRVEKLVTQVKNLLLTCESEKAKNAGLQQQIEEVRSENAGLRQQAARNEEQHHVPNFEPPPLKEQLEEAGEQGTTQGTKMVNSNLFLNCSPCEEDRPNPPVVKKTSQLASSIHRLLALMVGLLTCQDITDHDAERLTENEKASDIMLQKLKSFQLKKKSLDEELLKHKDRIETLRVLIANEKAFQDHIIEVTDFDSDEAKSVRDTPILLAAKLDRYHDLNEELDFLITKLGSLLESKEDHCNRLIEENNKYRRHVGNLVNKVISYEEIIKCADHRLEISHSQIAHLEERNKHLEDLIRTPREKARKSRPRLENHPKSMTLVGHIDGCYKECSISM